MSSSQDLGIFVHNNTEAEAQRSYAHAVEREPILTPLVFCIRVIVTEKPLNLEKTTSSILSVLLSTYAYKQHFSIRRH